jgi:hypothetical protein
LCIPLRKKPSLVDGEARKTSSTHCARGQEQTLSESKCTDLDPLARAGDALDMKRRPVDDADDPTEQHVSPATDATDHSRNATTGDRTLPDGNDELDENVILEVVPQTRHRLDIELSVMERELCDAFDGRSSLAQVADNIAISVRGARRLAVALLTRGVLRARTSRDRT